MRTFADRISRLLPALGPAAVAGVLPVFFIPISVDAYVLPRASATILAGCGAVMAAFALPSGRSRRLGELARPVAVIAVALLLATLTSISPNLSLIGSYGRYESLPVRLSYLLLFCLPVWMLRSQHQRHLVVSAYLAGCAVAGTEAIFEAYTGAPPRPDGNLGQANLLGALLAMAIPITTARSLRSPAGALLLIPLAGGLLVTGSRSGWLGALAGCAVLAPLLARSPRVRRWSAVACLLAVVAGLGALLLSPLAGLHGDTGAARLHVWLDSLPLIASHPLLGTGLESQGLVLGGHLSGDWEPGSSFDRVHELGLDLLVTQGVLGLAATAWFWSLWALRLLRQALGSAAFELRREEVPGLLAAWAGYLVVASINFDWAPATAPIWLLAGVGWSAMLPEESRSAMPRAGGRWSVTALLGASVIALLVAALIGVLPLAADIAYFRGNPRLAAELDPLQPRYHRALGQQLLAAGQLGQGAAELELAGRLGEYDAGVFVALGDAYRSLGDLTSARRAFRRAHELNRFDPDPVQRLKSMSEGP